MKSTAGAFGEKQMPNEILRPDLCVIGAGAAGLSAAAAAVQMGASVVLIERDKMGGDCLNAGCVPSKALIAAAKHAETLRSGSKFGIADAEPVVDFLGVMEHVKGAIAEIAPHDSQERFERLSVKVIREHGSFIDPKTVRAGGSVIKARRFVIATGSHPFLPPIPGLTEVPFHTNETIFETQVLPDHLIIIGAGPIGMELAQAFGRLGSKVTVIESSRALSKEDPELTKIILERLTAEGIQVLQNTKIQAVKYEEATFKIELFNRDLVIGSHLLIATGRRPTLNNLGLNAGNISTNINGIDVDDRLRSKTNKRVFAAGDVAGGMQHTHVAGYHAGIIIKNVLFRFPAKVNYQVIPRVTFTDPELAHVGLSEENASEKFNGAIKVLRAKFEDNDRAITEHKTSGSLKVITTYKGRVLGASIVGPSAGELILPWALAVQRKQKIGSLAQVIAAYPTLSEISKRAAGEFFAPKLFHPLTRKFVKLLSKINF
jgi:pyruvate/2-oxoglutarate dehydrogenase complex dihydrolipoamide dehydrogenase (E3) component